MSKKSPIFQNLKMTDEAEDYRVKKETMFDLPMRLLIIGKSQLSGKTNLLGNLLCTPNQSVDSEMGEHVNSECYGNDFMGRNIYVVCPSADLDSKWKKIIDVKSIPRGNIYVGYDEEELARLYERLQKRFNDAVREGRKPEHSLIVFDDISYSGSLKKHQHGVVAKLFQNGRHLLVSTIVLAQKYSDISTAARENATGMMVFQCSHKQAELIYEDIGNCEKRKFIKIFNDVTREPHTFLVVNFSNPPDRRYLDMNFNPIPELC